MIRRQQYRLGTVALTLVATLAAGCAEEIASDTEGAATPKAHAFASTTTPSRAASKVSTAAPTTRTRPANQSFAVNFAPGQLVVKFKSDDQLGVADDVETSLAGGRSFASITADGSPSLDAHVARHGIWRAKGLLPGRRGLSTHAAKAMLRGHAQKAARARGHQHVAPLDELANVYRLDLPASANLEAAMEDLRNDPHVEYVHPNYIAHLVYTPNDPYWSSSGSWGQPRADQWDLKLMHTEQAWDVSRGSGVVVAVVDTGVDIDHPDLTGNVWTNADEIPDNGIDDDGNGFVDDVHGWSTLDNSNQVYDNVGHGTHVAGTIAAQDNNATGIAGVAPDAKIMPVQVFSFSSDAFTLSQGLLYAVHNGADIINNSWHMCQGTCPTAGVVEDAVRTAHAAGIVVVFAAGNDNANIRDQSPQNLPEAIVVSATTPADTRAAFSNFGMVDVAAPGAGDPNDPNVPQPQSGILSLKSAGCMEPWICDAERTVGDRYVRLSGTSMAAPHAAGLAALILARNPTYSPEQVRQVIRRTSIDVNGNGFDPDLGYGRLDAAKVGTEPTPLEALIQAPLVVQTAQATIRGSAKGSQFQKYVLEVGKGAAPTTWTLIKSSTTQVSAGTLATWDASKLADGDYVLRLTVYKTDGSKYEDRHLLALDRVAITSPTAQSTLVTGDISILGIANPGTFKSFNVRVQAVETGAPVNANLALTHGGTRPVASGVLAVWHAQTIPAGHYRVILDVANVDGTLLSENVSLILDPLLHGGWPVNLTFHTFQGRGAAIPAEPIALADVDGDGRTDVVAGFGENVTVLRGDGSVLSGWPQSAATADTPYPSLKAMPVVGDVDGDGRKEVVAVTGGGTLFVWGSDGAVKAGWPRTISTPTEWGPMNGDLLLSLADVDRNGVLDIVATDAQQDGSGVHVIKGDGSYLPGWPVATYTTIRTPATVADLNKDGRNEVIVGSERSPARLVVFSSNGTVMPGWPQTLVSSTNDGQSVYPVVGDLDDDGDLEIAAIAGDGGGEPSLSKIVLFHHNGQRLRAWATEASQTGPLVLADLDGDGSLEVLATVMKMDGTGGLYAWDRKGNLLPGWPQSNPAPYPMFNTPIVVDLDGDGRNEVVVSRPNEHWSDELQINYGYPVQAYRHDGSLIATMARPAYGAWTNFDGSPAVADVDGDGRLELVWTEVREQGLSPDLPWPRVFTWDLTVSAGNAQPWPMYRADARHSGVAQTVVPIQKLTVRNRTVRVNGLARFQLQTSYGGQIQLRHPWQAVVKYAVGSNPLKQTTLGWGEQISVPPMQQVLLRVATSSPIDVTIDWW